MHQLADRSLALRSSLTESYFGRVSSYFALFLGSGLVLNWAKGSMPVIEPIVTAVSFLLFPIPIGVALTLLGLLARMRNKPLLQERVDCASKGYILSLCAYWSIFLASNPK